MPKALTRGYCLKEEQGWKLCLQWCSTVGTCQFVTVCPGLYCTGNLDISFPLPGRGASLFRHLDRCPVSPLEKWVKLLFSTLQFAHVERRGWGTGSAKWISFSEKAFPVSLVHLDPERGELPLRSGEGSKSRGFAWGEPWGSSAVGDPTPAHSQSWQSKAAWPGAESVYFLLSNLQVQLELRGFGFSQIFLLITFPFLSVIWIVIFSSTN